MSSFRGLSLPKGPRCKGTILRKSELITVCCRICAAPGPGVCSPLPLVGFPRVLLTPSADVRNVGIRPDIIRKMGRAASKNAPVPRDWWLIIKQRKTQGTLCMMHPTPTPSPGPGISDKECSRRGPKHLAEESRSRNTGRTGGRPSQSIPSGPSEQKRYSSIWAKSVLGKGSRLKTGTKFYSEYYLETYFHWLGLHLGK